MKLKHGLTIVLVAFFSQTFAQPMFYFRNIDVSDGLTSNFISSFCEDEQGFMWIGTRDGLVRYDGVSFEQYYQDPKDSSSLGSNSISWDIEEDKRGRLWIALHGYGLSRYDPRKEGFTNFSYSSGTFEHEWTNNAEQVIIAPDQSVYLVCQMGIVGIDTLDNVTTIHHVNPNKRNEGPANFRYAVLHNERWIWFTSSKGLRRYDLQNNTWEYPQHNPNNIAALSTGWDCQGAGYANETLWFSTFWPDKKTDRRYLYSYNIENDVLDSIPIAPDIAKENPFSNAIHAIEKSSDGTLWIGTEGLGLLNYDPKTQVWTQYLNTGEWSGNLLPGPVRILKTDSHNNLWIGTDRGVSLMAPNRQYFKNYSKVKDDKGRSIDLTEIGHMAVGPADDVWLGKRSKGLIHLDRNKAFLENLETISTSNSEYNDYIDPSFVKGDTLVSNVWYEGLFALNTATGKAFNYSTKTEAGHSELNNAAKLANGQVLAWGWGRAGKLDLASGNYDFVEPPINTDKRSDYVWDATLDHNGNIWVGLGQMGMICIDPNTMTIVDSWNRDTTRFSKTSVWKVLHRKGKIYFSLSAEGLGVMNIEDHTLNVYSKRNGLCSDDVNGLILDKQDDLWVYSPSGISWFDEENDRFRSFSEADGMISEHVKDAELLSDGNILMVTDRGLVEFDPALLKTVGGSTKPSLRSIQVYDQTINIYNWLRDSSKVIVPYNENYLRVEFSALEFFDPEKIQFAYRLAGAEERWNYTDHRPLAIYTNLRGGEYNLCVKRTNVDGVWGPELCVPVFVTTPFYLQLWFIVLVIIASILISYWIYKWQLKKKLAILEVRNQLSRDLHDDIGSALSSINIYSAVAQKQLNKDNDKAEKLLRRIGHSAGEMMQNMDDIIWTIDPGNDDVSQLVVRMREFAGPILEAKNIDLHLTISEKVNPVKLDMVKRRNLFLIYKEAVNNLAKYSEATKAEIEISLNNGELRLTISDNGKGFDTTAQSNRHGISNIRSRAEEINGNARITSAPENGTCVDVSIPIT